MTEICQFGYCACVSWVLVSGSDVFVPSYIWNSEPLTSLEITQKMYWTVLFLLIQWHIFLSFKSCAVFIVMFPASGYAIQHNCEPVPSPGKRGGLASGRAFGHKKCFKILILWMKTSNLCVAWKTDAKRWVMMLLVHSRSEYSTKMFEFVSQ